MNRAEFVSLLARVVMDGQITEADAVALLRLFDAGSLDLAAIGGSLQIAAGSVQMAQAGVLETLTQAIFVRVAANSVRGMELIDEIQAAYEANVATLARQVATTQIIVSPDRAPIQYTVQRWQQEMSGEIADHLVRQVMGAQGWEQLTVAQQQRLAEILARENAYLGRFADTLALRRAQGNPLSEGYIRIRAESYAGVGRAEAFLTNELRAGAEAGWVYEYQAVDDAGTCSPCHDARGYYLANQGPYPGAVCLGRSRCRCRRVATYAPDIYARLTGGTV